MKSPKFSTCLTMGSLVYMIVMCYILFAPRAKNTVQPNPNESNSQGIEGAEQNSHYEEDPRLIVEDDTHKLKFDANEEYFPFNRNQIYFYKAFYDNRLDMKTFRIFGLQRSDINLKLKCRFFTKDSESVDADMTYESISTKSGPPFIAAYYTCKQEMMFKINMDKLAVISDDTNTIAYIPIVKPVVPTKSSSVIMCLTSPIDGNLTPARLVEWFEINRLVGIEKFIVYLSYVNDAIEKVLKHYQNLGITEVIPFHLGKVVARELDLNEESEISALRAESELLAIQDCVYTRINFDSSHFLIGSLEKVWIPEDMNVTSTVKNLKAEFPKASGLALQTAFHWEAYGTEAGLKVPDHLFLQRYIRRSEPLSVEPSNLINPAGFVTANAYSVLKEIWNPSDPFTGNKMVDASKYGFVHHFEKSCHFSIEECAMPQMKYEIDKDIQALQSKLERRVVSVYENFKLT